MGPGLSLAGLESLGRASAYTLESVADRSEEGSARVSDGNRMVDLGWSIKATGLPVGPKTIATGTLWSYSA